MEAEQHAAEWPTNHRRNQNRSQNMHRNEWKWKHNNPKPVGHYTSSTKGKIHSNTGIPQETRKKSNKSPNSTPKATRKGRNGEPQA